MAEITEMTNEYMDTMLGMISNINIQVSDEDWYPTIYDVRWANPENESDLFYLAWLFLKKEAITDDNNYVRNIILDIIEEANPILCEKVIEKDEEINAYLYD